MLFRNKDERSQYAMGTGRDFYIVILPAYRDLHLSNSQLINLLKNAMSNTYITVIIYLQFEIKKCFILNRSTIFTSEQKAYTNRTSHRRMHFFLLIAYLLIFGYLYLLMPLKHLCVDMKLESDLRKMKTLLHLTTVLRMKKEKGSGCTVPQTHTFLENVVFMNDNITRITTVERDWVTCLGNECFVRQDILSKFKAVECSYSDVVFVNDYEHYTTFPIKLDGLQNYTLERSDHVKISCVQKTFRPFQLYRPRWNGLKAGIRKVSVSVPRGREDSLNVLILCLRSLSHNDALRRLPHTYKTLTEKLGAVVLNGYNAIGEGPPAALFPILTGKTEFELNNALEKDELDPKWFLFGQLHFDGYRTAYFEDMPLLSTLQLNFQRQPTDHYLRAFFLELREISGKCQQTTHDCVGTVPVHYQMINLTHQFNYIRDKRFSFTTISNIIGDNYHLAATVDDEILHMLNSLQARGILENTLLIVMSDRGSTLSRLTVTHQDAVEERLPFVSIVLPHRLKKARPDAERSLWANANVLTTPFDIHSTVLDVVGLKRLSNHYKVAESELPRGMSLLKAIPATRSCVEADVLPHWCACFEWTQVSWSDPAFTRSVRALADFVHDRVAEDVRCAKRTVASIEWVMRYNFRKQIIQQSYMENALDTSIEFYQVRMIMKPGRAIFEGTVTLLKKLRAYVTTEQQVSRIDICGNEAKCVSATRPHLSKYCYCNANAKTET